MAICDCCKQEMTNGLGCRALAVEYPDDLALSPIPCGESDLNPDNLCGDCRAPLGMIHHPGCDRERCPRCGGQLIGCGCLSLRNYPVAIEARIGARKIALEQGDTALADEIKREMEYQDAIYLTDTPHGTTWELG